MKTSSIQTAAIKQGDSLSADTNISNITHVSPLPSTTSSIIAPNPDDNPSSIQNPNPVNACIPIDSSSLNRSDCFELMLNAATLDAQTVRYLQLVARKPELYPHRFRDPDYLAHSSILLTSHWGSSSSHRYAHCCRPNPLNRSGTCQLHQYCCYCCYLKQQSLLQQFLPRFHQASWHSITLSFHGDLPFDTFDAVPSHWAACKAGLSTLLEEKLIDGYYCTRELKINSFLPCRVLPHFHAVVVAESFDESAEARLAEAIAANPYVTLTPSIQAKSIADESGFYNHLRYLYKPLNLLEPYRREWQIVEANPEIPKWKLNSAVSDCLGRYCLINYQRPKMFTAGVMHPQHAQYLGVPTNQRQDYRDLVDSIAANAPWLPSEAAA